MAAMPQRNDGRGREARYRHSREPPPQIHPMIAKPFELPRRQIASRGAEFFAD
jgi:hypothetical protein